MTRDLCTVIKFQFCIKANIKARVMQNPNIFLDYYDIYIGLD